MRVQAMRVLALLSLLSASFLVGLGSAGAAASPNYMFSGHGYATYVGGGGLKPQKTANVVMWCRTKPGIHHSNSVATVGVPSVLTAGEAVSKVDGVTTASGKKAATATDVHNVSLVGGLITADELKAMSTTVHRRAGFLLSDAGAVWSNINIAGQPLPSQVPAPNTRVDLPGVGYAVLNEQTKKTSATRALFTVNMVHVYETLDNPVLGTKKGTQIIVGHALSGLIDVAGPMGGKAYTTQLNAAGLLSSGPSAVMYLPCAGTDGRVKTDTLGGLGLPGVLGVGSGMNTGSGVVTPSKVKADVVSTAQNLRLLGGAITADAINSHVHATKLNGVRKFTDLSTGFVNLVVNGQAVGGNVPPNTKMAIPGVGTLFLHRVQRTKNVLHVTMLELKIGQATGGLPAGTVLRIVSAAVSIY